MASLNKVTLIGNLGADPEVRYLDGGGVVAQFNVATTEKFTNRNGERVEQTEWFRVELWNEQAKVAEQYLRKGNPVYVEGRLRTETWVDKEGKERFSLRVRAATMQLLGSRNDDSGSQYESAPAPRQQQAAPQPAPAPRQQQTAPQPAASQPAPARQPKPAPAPAAFDASGDDDLPF